MKLLASALASSAGVWLSGCASERPPAEVVQEHLQRGASGQGTLGPLDRGPDDPFINPRTGDSSPGHP